MNNTKINITNITNYINQINKINFLIKSKIDDNLLEINDVQGLFDKVINDYFLINQMFLKNNKK